MTVPSPLAGNAYYEYPLVPQKVNHAQPCADIVAPDMLGHIWGFP
jgi:hypothetical protein